MLDSVCSLALSPDRGVFKVPNAGLQRVFFPICVILQQALMTNRVNRVPLRTPVTSKRFPCAPPCPWLPYSASPDPVGTGARRPDTCTLPRRAPSSPLVSPRLVSSPTRKNYLDDTGATCATSRKSLRNTCEVFWTRR